MTNAPQPPSTSDRLSLSKSSIFSDDMPIVHPVGINGLRIAPQTITLISAPPGIGKSSLSSQLLFDAIRLDPKLKVLLTNVEMTFEMIIKRELARLSKVPLSNILNKTWNAEEKQRAEIAYSQISNIAERFHFVEMPFDLKAVWQTITEFEPDIVCLDYIQKIRVDAAKDRQDQRSEIEHTMDHIRLFANRGLAFIVISSMNRSTTGEAYSGNLNMGRMFGSSSIEYAVDDLFILQEDDVAGNTHSLKHLKSRSGERQSIALNFDGRFQRWCQR